MMVVFFKVTKDAPPIGGIRVSCTLKVCKKCIRGLLEAWRGACTDPVRSVGGAAVRGSVVVHARALSLARVRHKLPPRGCASAGYPTFPPRVNVGFTRRCGRTRGARCARWACGGAGRPSPAFVRGSARRGARNGPPARRSLRRWVRHTVWSACPRPHGACRRSRRHPREPTRAPRRVGAARAGPPLWCLVRRQVWHIVRCVRAWSPSAAAGRCMAWGGAWASWVREARRASARGGPLWPLRDPAARPARRSAPRAPLCRKGGITILVAAPSCEGGPFLGALSQSTSFSGLRNPIARNQQVPQK